MPGFTLPGKQRATLPQADGSRFSYGHLATAAVVSLSIIGPNLSMKSEAASGEGSPLRQALYLLAFGIALAGARPLQQPRRLAAVPVSILLALGWCLVSLTWSPVPAIGLRRLFLTALVIWTIFLGVRRAGYDDSVTIMRWVMIVTLVLNYLAVFLMPAVGVHQNLQVGDTALIGAWRGILLQKNFAGAACAFTILLMIFGSGRMSLVWRGAVLAASALFLWMTMSKTSLGIVILATVIGGLQLWYNRQYRLLLVPLTMVAAVAVIMYLTLNWEAIVAALNDPLAFTGRAQIWAPLFAFANDHPLTGVGYGSFWNTGGARTPIHEYAEGWITRLNSAHNGYLELLVQIGVPGLIISVLGLIVIPIVRLFVNRRIPRMRAALMVSFLIFCAGHNFTESSLLDRDMLVQVVTIFTIALIGVAVAATDPGMPRRARVRART